MDNAVVRARSDLQEAVREIHIMAGLGPDERANEHERPVVIGITSPTYGDGKTTVAIALAASLSSDLGAQVTLVDADLQTHSIGEAFGLHGRGGLTDIVAGTISLADARYPVQGPNLTVIGAGTATLEAARVAYSTALRQTMSTIRSESQFVIVDLPATNHSMTAPILAQRCDGVVIVARSGHSTIGNIERVAGLLRDTNVMGVVINRARSHIPAFVERALNLRR